MTTIAPILTRPRTAKAVLSSDITTLLDLADQLQGRVVPGVRLTEQQFLDWQQKGVRAEWENGEVILMTSPSGEHVDLNGWLVTILLYFVEQNDLGLVRMPFSVRLADSSRLREPDILFVAKRRLSIVGTNRLDGPPDLAVEIVSPDSSVRDWRTKYFEYELAGVAEYWVVDPALQRFDLYVLKAKKYQQQPVDNTGRVQSKVLRGLFIKPAWLWKKPLPKLAPIFKELGLR